MKIDPEQDRIIRKIKRCMAIAESDTANENEAAMAMRQAKALMRDYRISAKMIAFSEIGTAESKFVRATRRPRWDRNLSAVVAEVFNCEVLCHWKWVPGGKWVETATFIGVTPSEHIALYAYETLLRKLTADRRQYASDVRKGVRRSRYTAETSANHFALAWVSAVWQKLEKLIPTGEDEKGTSTGTDLVSLEKKDRELIQQYMSSLDVQKARSARRVELDPAAVVAGLAAGTAAEVNHALSTDGEEQLAIEELSDVAT